MKIKLQIVLYVIVGLLAFGYTINAASSEMANISEEMVGVNCYVYIIISIIYGCIGSYVAYMLFFVGEIVNDHVQSRY